VTCLGIVRIKVIRITDELSDNERDYPGKNGLEAPARIFSRIISTEGKLLEVEI